MRKGRAKKGMREEKESWKQEKGLPNTDRAHQMTRRNDALAFDQALKDVKTVDKVALFCISRYRDPITNYVRCHECQVYFSIER